MSRTYSAREVAAPIHRLPMLDTNANMRSVSVGPSPYAWFLKSIERRSLAQAETAARELGGLQKTEDSLRLVLLLGEQGDARYSRAIMRWFGQWIADNEAMGLAFAASLADALAELYGASRDVARSRVAVLLRQAGDTKPAEVLERW